MFCSHDDKINILSVETGKVVHAIKQEDGDEVTCFVVSPDDEILVVAYKNLLLKQWNWKEGKCTRTWRAIHRGPIVSMAFDGTSTLLATGSSDFTIKVWDIIRQYCTHNFKGSLGVVSVVEFHPDPEKLQLFSAGEDCKFRIWDLRSSESKAVLSSHNSVVTSFAFSKDAKTLLTGGRDNIVIIWNLESYERLKTIPIYEAVEFVMLIPNQTEYEKELNLTMQKGFHFITVGAEGVLKVWNSESSNCVFKQKQPMASKDVASKGVEAAITQAMYCPELDVIALVSYDHNVLLYTLKGFQLSKQFVGYNEEVLDVKFMGERGSHIAVASNSEQIRVFELSSHSCQILTGHTDIVLELDVFKRGLMLASCSKDNTVRLWSMDSDTGNVFCVAVGKGHTHSVGTVATARLSNNFLVSGSEDQTIKVWLVPSNLPTEPGQPDTPLKVKFAERAHDKDINSVDISPNDKLLATGSQDRTAKLWHLDQEVMLGSFRGHKRGIWCVRFSPTDQALATSSADGTIKIWALTNFSCVKTFEGHDASVMKVVFLSRGMQLLSCGSDGLLKLWTIKSNECVKTLDEHTQKVWTLTANDDENLVVSGGADSNLIVWEEQFRDILYRSRIGIHDRVKGQLMMQRTQFSHTWDSTEIEEEEERAKMEDQLLKEQQLSNLLHEKKYLKAIGLAITLDQPFRLLNIIKTIMEEPEGLEGLEITLGKLRSDQIDATLRFANQWNTNSKHCHTAQTVISIILKGNSPEDLIKNPDMQQTLEGLIPYTERHFQRMNRLLQQAMFVEHTWQMMRRATAPTESLELPTLGTDVMGSTESDLINDLTLQGQRLKDRRLSERSNDSDESSTSESSESESEVESTSDIVAKHKQVGDEEASDDEESNHEDENERTVNRTKTMRSPKGQLDDQSSVDEEMESEMNTSQKSSKRQRKSEDKENDIDDKNIDGSSKKLKTKPKVGKKKTTNGVQKKGDTSKGTKPKKTRQKTSSTPSATKTSAKQASIDSYITPGKHRSSNSSAAKKTSTEQAKIDSYTVPRKTRSSNIANRLRKTSTSSR